MIFSIFFPRLLHWYFNMTNAKSMTTDNATFEKCKFESEIRSDILLFPQSMFTKVHRNETSDTYINYVLDAFLI